MLLAVFSLELEMDYPSETSLCTVPPSRQTAPCPIFSEGRGCTATEMIPTTEMIPAVTTEMIPGISGMELRGLQKLDNNLVRAFYLFILHPFYGV